MFDSILDILIIIFGFGVLIFFHELGHFLAAKWAGIRAEAFAVGMGPVMFAYRRGIGIRPGSTERSVLREVENHLRANGDSLEAAANDDERRTKAYRTMDALGIGETEYSLRWLPIGGFVKMLGQEDANPQATSDLPGSYQNTPIGKRMIVVSAGVIANVILAVVFFMWAFLAGVPMEAPIVGRTIPGMPAATATAVNAAEVGVQNSGLQPGDRIASIDGDNAETFSDLMIAAAMGTPDTPVRLQVEREVNGEPRELVFEMKPQKSEITGLLGFGIAPANSTQLIGADRSPTLESELADTGLAEAGVEPGMTMLRADGEPVELYHSLARIVSQTGGAPVRTEWGRAGETGDPVGATIEAMLPAVPELQSIPYLEDGKAAVASGLLGLSPLAKVTAVDEKSPNLGVIREGDVFLELAGVVAPRQPVVPVIVGDRAGEAIPALVLRDGEEVPLSLRVNDRGRIGIVLGRALDTPYTADPIEQSVEESGGDAETAAATPVADAEIYPGSRFISVDQEPVTDWRSFRAALRNATADAHAAGSGDIVAIEFELRIVDSPVRTVEINLSPEDVASLHELGWRPGIESLYFQPAQTLLSAHGNPLTATAMGFERTWKFIIHTYLTIDRLFRGTVGVEQLRGPVGIVHLGLQIADRGVTYIVFFLAMISVNLAVINFLPIPIVDGGLFLFLVYEKIKGRPPSVAFQNAAMIVGLMLIAGIFLLVTYNDIARLITGS